MKNVTNNARKARITRDEGMLETILARVANGEILLHICSEPDMPTRKSFYEWVRKDPELQRKYEEALDLRADIYAEQIIAISDDGSRDRVIDPETGVERIDHDHIARSRLRVDARKWYASKLAPKKYGDKIEHNGPDGGPVQFMITNVDANL